MENNTGQRIISRDRKELRLQGTIRGKRKPRVTLQ